jgi:hypothetical protein
LAIDPIDLGVLGGKLFVIARVSRCVGRLAARHVDTDDYSIRIQSFSEKPQLVNELTSKGAVGMVIAREVGSIGVEKILSFRRLIK